MSACLQTTGLMRAGGWHMSTLTESLKFLSKKALPHFGDVVVIHHAFKKPPSFENRGSTGVCLGHDSRIAGGVLVVSVVNGELREVYSAKVRKLGERVGQAWRLHVHPQDSSRAAYVNRKGEVKWNLQDIEVPTVEQCVKEDALEVQDIRELGLGWASFVNYLRAFLPAWQDMELATPSTEEPLTQVAGDVPLDPPPVRADATRLEVDTHAYERLLAISPFGASDPLPDWQDTHAMHACVPFSSLGHWVRTDLGVRTFQGLGRNAPKREQVVRRLTKDVHTEQILESLPCEFHLQVPFSSHCIDVVYLDVWSPHLCYSGYSDYFCLQAIAFLSSLIAGERNSLARSECNRNIGGREPTVKARRSSKTGLKAR